MAAEEAHDRKLLKSLEVCQRKAFTLYLWRGSQQEATVHETVRKWTELARGGYPAYLIRRNLYAQISCSSQRHLAKDAR